jgi:transposase
VLTLPPSVKIWCATTPTDLRRGPDGLSALVRSQLHADPLSGHLFVFFNRKADRIKVLYWDRDGMCVWYKKLETEDSRTFGFTEPGRPPHNQ